MTIHAAMIERIDIELGRIITQLKSMNSFEDTVIFFCPTMEPAPS